MLVMIALYGAFIVFLGQFNNQSVQLVLSESKTQKTTQLNDLVQLSGTNERAVANDYSLWDDMVKFVKTADPAFAHINIDTAITSFKIDQAWVYRLDGTLVYTVQSPALHGTTVVVPAESFPEVNRNHTQTFYLDTPKGIMEIVGYTVQPSTDDKRVTPPNGYWFVGRLLGIDTAALSRLMGGVVTLRKQGVPMPTTNNPATFVISNTLQDWSGGRIGDIDAVIHATLADTLATASADFIRISLLFGVASLIVLFILLYVFVSRPMQILSEGLREKRTDRVKLLESNSSEFGALAVTIDQFFDQQLKIEQEKARTEALLESIGDAIIGIDRNWNIVFLNGAAKLILGSASTAALGKSLRDVVRLMRVRDRVEYVTFIEEALLYGKQTTTEEDAYLIGAEGKEITVMSFAAPIFGTDHKPVGAVVVIHNVEKEQDARRLRSDFAYASHQLRTPVTEAMWAINAALDEGNMNTKNADLHIAARSIKSVNKLVEHLLEVSQLDQQTSLPKKEKVAITDLFTATLRLIDTRAKERGIKIQMPAQISPISLTTDAAFMQRILFEIVENAVAYAASDSEVVVTVHDQNDGAVFSVQNTGIPIPEKELPLVFTKFFRGYAAGEATAGAGLGLYIAREYTKLLKGKMWFTSDEQVTTFFVFIPYA